MKLLAVTVLFLAYVSIATACTGLSGIPSVPIGGGGGGRPSPDKKCLHKDAEVLMADGRSVKKAGDLVIGDRVWSENGQGSPVILTPDTKVDQVHPFVVFKTKSGLSATLTPDHAVFARQCGSQKEETWPIKRCTDLVMGDCVPLVNGEEDRVVSIGLTEMSGRVHPITESGKLVVDGVVISCYDYSGVNSTQESKHAPFEPARMLHSFGEKIYASLSNEEYALGLLESLIRGMGLEKLYQ